MNNPFSLGMVKLNVRDLPTMAHFYQEVIGLDLISQTDTNLILGKDQHTLLSLHHSTAAFPMRNAAGLYHFALLFARRTDLAATIQRILQIAPQFFSGSADHLVSEAFYLSDPEGNGIELYFDRDRTAWRWENGQVRMATLYLDPEEYIQRNIVLETEQLEPISAEESTLPITVGHIHLKVGNLETARKFYVDTLGFEVTAEMPSALFISIGGYHHHLGLNTWESFGATERADSLGLKSFEFILADSSEVMNLKQRLEAAHLDFVDTVGSISFHDPWHNQITVTC